MNEKSTYVFAIQTILNVFGLLYLSNLCHLINILVGQCFKDIFQEAIKIEGTTLLRQTKPYHDSILRWNNKESLTFKPAGKIGV